MAVRISVMRSVRVNTSSRIGRERCRSATPLSQVHGLGRHGRGLDDVGRHPERHRRSAQPAHACDGAACKRGAALRADQRQPHRLRQAGEHRRHRHAARGDREDQGRARTAGVRPPHRRPDAPLASRRSSTRCSRCCRSCRCRSSTCPASTTCSKTTAELPASGSARARRAPAGTASTRAASHFIGLVNVVESQGGRPRLARRRAARVAGEGRRAASQSSTPDRRLRAHSALDGLSRVGMGHRRQRAGARRYLKRFGSVSVLNGHIHQVMQKVEGNVTFHTAMSTAFPQPAPGTAPSPGPMKVADDRLRKVLGLSRMSFHGVQLIRSPSPTCRSKRDSHTSGGTTSRSTTSASRRRRPRCRSVRRSPGRTATTSRTPSSAPSSVQVAGPRHRRTVLSSVRRAGHVHVLLLAPSAR